MTRQTHQDRARISGRLKHSLDIRVDNDKVKRPSYVDLRRQKVIESTGTRKVEECSKDNSPVEVKSVKKQGRSFQYLKSTVTRVTILIHPVPLRIPEPFREHAAGAVVPYSSDLSPVEERGNLFPFL